MNYFPTYEEWLAEQNVSINDLMSKSEHEKAYWREMYDAESRDYYLDIHAGMSDLYAKDCYGTQI